MTLLPTLVLDMQSAIDGVSKPGCLLWASMPCIGGSPWQHINRHNPGGLEKLDAHVKDWYKIWTAFKAVARECIKHNGHIAVEWPLGCDYVLEISHRAGVLRRAPARQDYI